MTPAGAESDLSIAIVGAGIIGLSAGWRLAQAGWKVTVFDKSSVGKEASWAGAGMLSPGGEVEGPSILASLAIESRRLYPAYICELQKSTGYAIDFQECGGLDLAYSQEECTALEEKARVQASLGIESHLISPGEVVTLCSKVRMDGLTGARFYPGDAIVNPRDVVSALQKACQQLGASLIENCPVLRVDVGETKVTLTTSRRTEEFSSALIAAGAWSDSITVAGVPPLPASEPVKGHLIAYEQPQHTADAIVRHLHTYLLQRANGLLIVGASSEHVGFDRTVKPEVVASLNARAGFIFPHLTATPPDESWVGFRPGSDALHIGRWHSNRFYLAYGHFRNGILLAPITARQIIDEAGHRFSMSCFKN